METKKITTHNLWPKGWFDPPPFQRLPINFLKESMPPDGPLPPIGHHAPQPSPWILGHKSFKNRNCFPRQPNWV